MWTLFDATGSTAARRGVVTAAGTGSPLGSTANSPVALPSGDAASAIVLPRAGSLPANATPLHAGTPGQSETLGLGGTLVGIATGTADPPIAFGTLLAAHLTTPPQPTPPQPTAEPPPAALQTGAILIPTQPLAATAAHVSTTPGLPPTLRLVPLEHVAEATRRQDDATPLGQDASLGFVQPLGIVLPPASHGPDAAASSAHESGLVADGDSPLLLPFPVSRPTRETAQAANGVGGEPVAPSAEHQPPAPKAFDASLIATVETAPHHEAIETLPLAATQDNGRLPVAEGPRSPSDSHPGTAAFKTGTGGDSAAQPAGLVGRSNPGVLGEVEQLGDSTTRGVETHAATPSLDEVSQRPQSLPASQDLSHAKPTPVEPSAVPGGETPATTATSASFAVQGEHPELQPHPQTGERHGVSSESLVATLPGAEAAPASAAAEGLGVNANAAPNEPVSGASQGATAGASSITDAGGSDSPAIGSEGAATVTPSSQAERTNPGTGVMGVAGDVRDRATTTPTPTTSNASSSSASTAVPTEARATVAHSSGAQQGSAVPDAAVPGDAVLSDAVAAANESLANVPASQDRVAIEATPTDPGAELAAHEAARIGTATSAHRSSSATATPETPPQLGPLEPQLSSAIERAMAQRPRPLRVQLDPPELGTLAIEIVQRPGGVEVRVEAELADTGRLLREHVEPIRELAQRILSQSSATEGGVDVFVGSREQSGADDRSPAERPRGSGHESRGREEEASENAAPTRVRGRSHDHPSQLDLQA